MVGGWAAAAWRGIGLGSGAAGAGLKSVSSEIEGEVSIHVILQFGWF